MKHDETVAIRIPKKLREAIERERRRASRELGTEVKESAIVRGILERALLRPARRRSAA